MRNNFETETNPFEAESPGASLTPEERRAVLTRADLRRQAQELKVDLLNLELPEGPEAFRQKHEETIALVKKEADGAERISKEEAERFLKEEAEDVRNRADLMQEMAPDLSACLWLNLVKCEQAAGLDFQKTIQKSNKALDLASALPKLIPSSLLPNAILVGINRRVLKEAPLPSMTKVAKIAAKDQELLENYGLVLEEKEREKFLSLIPENQRRQVSIILDRAVSPLLHASLVEKGTTEEEQRRRVRIRLFEELQNTLSQPESSDKKLTKLIANGLSVLGEDTRQLFLEIIRDEFEAMKEAGDSAKVPDNLPRIIKVMLDNFDDWRANDIILRLAASEEINPHLSIYLFGKLVDRGYLPADVKEWWDSEKKKAGRLQAAEKQRLLILQAVVNELGVVPSRQILEFIGDDKRWQKGGQKLGLTERIETIKASQAEFAGVSSNLKLTRLLAGDENKAMMYYLLFGGQDRFNLINNYDFGKFKEIVSIIGNPEFAREHNLTPLEIHEQPIRRFREALISSGLKAKEVDKIIQNLRNGHFPLKNQEQSCQEVSFEISENAAVNNANAEIGRVLAREQLGVILSFPLYREYLEQADAEIAKDYLSQMSVSNTFADRLSLMTKIDQSFPAFREKVKQDLQEAWIKFGEKMVIELTLDQALNSDSVSIRGEELLPRLDAKRIDLKRINKELLALLRGESKAISDIQHKLAKKRKAWQGLAFGIEKQTDIAKRGELEKKVGQIDAEIKALELKRFQLGEARADERFAHLTPEEKKIEIDGLSKKLIALTEKSPSAIFTYITMQVLGEERLRESDIALVRELESHLQGPFQTITDMLTYEKGRSDQKKQMRVGLQYLDKAERLMTMVRFADSKICCFSSSNYEVRVQHDTPNKFWVASINADPLSFVISMEIPRLPSVESTGRQVKENIGFIFGNYGLSKAGELAIMLNGIYYAPGIENEKQVEAILSGVEKIFKGLPLKGLAIATQHGGAVKMPKGYSKEAIELIRLRALDGGDGRPETQIYDDLGTGSDLNKPHIYQNFVWHKEIIQKV